MGLCPYCNRHVAKDLRPINMLSAQDAKRISRLLNDVQPPLHLESEEEMQDQEEKVLDNDPCAQEELNESYDSQDKLEENDDPKGSAKEDNLESLDAITGCVLGLVEKEFERDPDCSESSETLEGNAEVIVAMLNEEQDMMQKIRKRSSQCSSRESDEPPAKKRKC
ncbi:GD12273 [Drosophila simulans]|uniref:GD12273 n=1 Tax=Drosophila simulans TaxID=7240 RepID=B4QQU7_DROSI|nr:GD12273 [Drosophila simulans]